MEIPLLGMRGRERDGFEAALAAHEQMVLRVAYRFLRSTDAARDVAQDVFLKLHREWPKLNDDRNIAAWLYRVTVNESLDARRAGARRAEELAEIADSAMTPEQSASAREQTARLHRAIARLPEKEQAAVVLRELEWLSSAEVAAILGTSESTVRAQVFSARQKLREWLSAGGTQ